MQRFGALTPARRSLPALFRALSTENASPAIDDHLQNEVLVEGKASSRTAILNRPSALNALNNNMGIRLTKFYESWEDNPDVGFVLLKGSGRVFCAGGDVAALYRFISEGKVEKCKEFFWNLYSFMYIVGTYLKPHVSILNGVTMGGGAGVSIPGTFRIATDRTIFATPEVHIGFHPDAGASFHLSHLTGHLGEYLALTGERLNGVDMLATGLATHYSTSARLGWVDERLAKLITDDPSVIDKKLVQYGDIVYPYKDSIIHRLDVIDRCFSHETIEEIMDAVESEAAITKEKWCVSALKKLKEASPLSLKVSLRAIREGRSQTFDQCLVREYRMSLNGTLKEPISRNFSEGVRARLIDKDFSPKWDPPTLDKVSEDMVDCYFSPLEEFEPDLKLPTNLREASISFNTIQ